MAIRTRSASIVNSVPAIASNLGGGPTHASNYRPDTPARLEAALSTAIANRTGRGSPHVLRSPGALHTPEAWQLRIEGIDAGTYAALERAIRGGSFV